MERIAWGFACGLLLHSTLYGFLIALRANPGPKKLLAAEALLCAAALFASRRKTLERGKRGSGTARSVIELLCLGVATGGSALFLITALAEPMWATDYLAIWGLKGKTIYLTASLPSRLFHDPALFWSQPEYPLLLPLAFAALSASIGQWNDRALALLYPACQVMTILLACGFLTRRISRKVGLVAASLIALFFPLYAPVNVGMADIPLAFGVLLLSCAFLDALGSDTAEVRLRLGIAGFFSASLKQEGSLYVLMLLFALFVFARRARWIPLASSLALPVLLNWGFLGLMRGRIADRDLDATLLRPERWGELAARAGEMAGWLLRVEIPEAFVLILGVAGFFLLTRPAFADRLLLPLASQTAIYAAVCTLSAYGAVWWLETSFARITSALFPALALVLGARLPDEARSSYGKR